MRWAGHVAHARRREINTWFWWKVLKELNHFKYQDAHEDNIKVYIKETGWEDRQDSSGS